MGCVLVTGGSGVVGSATVEAMRKRGASVISLGRSECCDLRCDVRDPTEVKRAIADATPSTIIHAAYMLADRTPREPREAIAVNVLGFFNVLDASAAAGVPSFLYASSIAVYDDARYNGSAYLAPRSAYGTMKLLNEQQAATGPFSRCCGVRIANVYHDGVGRGQSGWLSTAIHAALAGGPVRVGLAPGARLSVIWAEDVGDRLAKLALAPIDEPWPSVLNSGGEEIAGKELGEALTRAGASDVKFANNSYPYPTAISSPELDLLVGRPVLKLSDVLPEMERARGTRPTGGRGAGVERAQAMDLAEADDEL